MMTRTTLKLMCTVALLLGGCSKPFETRDAYQEQRYLCTNQHLAEWNALVDACRQRWQQDRSCGGVASFQGVLEGQEVTVESVMDHAVFYPVVHAGDARPMLDRVDAMGLAPYFGFTLTWKELGGLARESLQNRRILRIVSGEVKGLPGATDDKVRFRLRLNAGGDNQAITAEDGTMTVTLQDQDQLVATFATEFPEGDHLVGCVHAFSTGGADE